MTTTPREQRNSATLDIITRTLQDLGKPGAPAFTMVHFEERLPLGQGHQVECVAHFTYAELAEHINTSLYGRSREQHQVLDQTPEQLDETTANLDAYGQLLAQPWYPARAGDLVHVAYEATGDVPAFGETYRVEIAALSPVPTWVLPLIHHTAFDVADAGLFASGDSAEPLLELWIEAGQDRVTVVRDGVVLHNGPASRRG